MFERPAAGYELLTAPSLTVTAPSVCETWNASDRSVPVTVRMPPERSNDGTGGAPSASSRRIDPPRAPFDPELYPPTRMLPSAATASVVRSPPVLAAEGI